MRVSRLNEDSRSPVIYQDTDSGKYYIWDGSEFKEYIQKDGDNNSDSGDGIKSGESSKNPQLGDTGDDDIQSQEEAEREQENTESQEELEDRIKKLKAALEDEDIEDKISSEAEEKVSREKLERELKQAEKEAQQFRNSPLTKFRMSLDKFIKKQIGMDRVDSWSRVNKNYVDSGIMRKGRATRDNGMIPSINVYFDRSGSWDASKTEVGEKAIASLNKYVRQGKLRVNVFYFNTRVFSEYTKEGRGGTRGTPIINHIKQTKPDNVVVMTDDDIDDCTEVVTVPGAVWFLFRDGVSDNIFEHIKGQKQTEMYEI